MPAHSRRPQNQQPIAPLRWPVTFGVGLMALVMTGLWWLGNYDASGLMIDARAVSSEPWRLLTSTLLHGGPLHLLFNLYWLWIFGRFIEDWWGQTTTFGLFALFGVVSSAAEYAVFSGGIGLSGIGYGLFAMLWVAGRRDRRYQGVVDNRTAALFVGWFFFCIAATIGNVMSIANVAHGAGALIGACAGLVVTTDGGKRVGAIAGTLALTALVFAGATVGRPAINLSGGGESLAIAGDDALDAEDPKAALAYYDRALAKYGDKARWHFNRGVALQRLDEPVAAAKAFKRAFDLRPDRSRYRDAMRDNYAYLAHEALRGGDYRRAIDYYRTAFDAGLEDPAASYNFGIALESVGRTDQALEAYERAAKLDPDNEKYRATVERMKGGDVRPPEMD